MFSFLIFLDSTAIEAMDATSCTSLSKLRCNLTTYPQNTKHACHQCAYEIFSADCSHTFQRSTEHVQTTTQNSFQHISLLHCALLILMNVLIKEEFLLSDTTSTKSEPNENIWWKKEIPQDCLLKPLKTQYCLWSINNCLRVSDSFKEEHPEEYPKQQMLKMPPVTFHSI